MFYEQSIIDGALHFRTSPLGEWTLAVGPRADAANALLALVDEDRLEIMRLFCAGCGRAQPHDARPCHCKNDE